MKRKSTAKQERRLAAILFADIVGYTAMMQSDEPRAMQVLQEYKLALNEHVPKYGGEIIKNYGDGSICLFTSAVSCVQCARDIQMRIRHTVPLRIGLHLGDVIHKEDDIYGDAINISSRVESMGIPGNVLVSKSFHEKVKNQPELQFVSLGSFDFKNVDDSMEVFALSNEGMIIPKSKEIKGKFKETPNRSNLLKWMTLIIALILLSFVLYEGLKNDTIEPITNNTIALDFWERGKSAMPDGHGSQEDYAKALDLFRQAIDLDPDFAEAWASLGLASQQFYWFGYDTRASRLDSALVYLNKAESLKPGMDEVLQVRSRIHYSLREYDKALIGYSKLLEKNPDDVEILPRLADVQRRQGFFELAIETRKKIAILDPLSTENYVEMAWSYLILKDYTSAFEMRDKALQIDPKEQWAYFMGALIHWGRGQEGDLQQAHDLLKAVPVVESSYPAFFWIRQYWLEGDFGAALNKIKNLAEPYISIQHAYYPKDLLLGITHRFLGNSDEAKSAFVKALELLKVEVDNHPNDFRMHIALGSAYAGLGLRNETLVASQKAVEILPLEKDALMGQDALFGQMENYAFVGAEEEALDIMVKITSKPSQIQGLFFTANPFLMNLWDHPRFIDIVSRRSTDQVQLKN